MTYFTMHHLYSEFYIEIKLLVMSLMTADISDAFDSIDLIAINCNVYKESKQ